MVLAEQGCDVTKWVRPDDPILGLIQGDELWEWVNHGKTLTDRHVDSINATDLAGYDIVVDNIRASAWDRFGVDPQVLADELGVVWVSVRSETGARSFDVIAQAQTIMEHGPPVPWFIGDTSVGLWAAYKAMSMFARGRSGHAVVYQATALAKLVEGELVVDRPKGDWPFDDQGTYFGDEHGGHVFFRGEWRREPIRDRQWKLDNLRHVGGRLQI